MCWNSSVGVKTRVLGLQLCGTPSPWSQTAHTRLHHPAGEYHKTRAIKGFVEWKQSWDGTKKKKHVCRQACYKSPEPFSMTSLWKLQEGSWMKRIAGTWRGFRKDEQAQLPYILPSSSNPQSHTETVCFSVIYLVSSTGAGECLLGRKYKQSRWWQQALWPLMHVGDTRRIQLCNDCPKRGTFMM